MAASRVTQAAEKLSKGSAQLALQLIGYNQDVATAMEYVFGGAFICKVCIVTFSHQHCYVMAANSP